MESSPLDSLYYITLPKDFKPHFSFKGFDFDVSVPLPVQKKQGQKDTDKDTYKDTYIENTNTKDLTQEQVLSGLLYVLAYDKQNPHTQYYRDLVLKARPNMKTQLLQGAVVKTKNQDWDLAQEMFLCLSGLDPNDKAITLNMALFYDQRADDYRKHNFIQEANSCDAKAQNLYQKCIATQETLANAYFNLGFFYLKQDMFSKALETFNSYIAFVQKQGLDPQDKNASYKLDRAKQIVQNITHSKLDDKEYYEALQLIKTGGQENEKKGLEKLHKFLVKSPTCANAWFMLGWGLRKQKRYTDAIKAFSKALDLGQDANADCYNEMAICLIETGDLPQAKKMLETALSFAPEDTKIISNLGYYYLKEGNDTEAKKYFLTVLEFDPQDKIAAFELKKLEMQENLIKV